MIGNTSKTLTLPSSSALRYSSAAIASCIGPTRSFSNPAKSGRVAAGERGLPIEGVAIELAAGQELLGDQPLDVAAQIKVAEIGGRRGPCQPDNG